MTSPTDGLPRIRAARLEAPEEQPLLPRLSGAASLRAELETLLAAAPPDATPTVYRQLVLSENVAGKRSGSAQMWLWKRIKLRYVLDLNVPEFQAFLYGMRAATSTDERGLLCFLMLGRTDRLFREVVLECVSPFLDEPGREIKADDINQAVRRRAGLSGRSGKEWSENTFNRTHKHLLTSLKDFGVLIGSNVKRTARPRPGGQTALFAARLARLQGLTDRQILESDWFKQLGLNADRAVDLLYVANRSGALGFKMQADVVEVTLPPLEAA